MFNNTQNKISSVDLAPLLFDWRFSITKLLNRMNPVFQNNRNRNSNFFVENFLQDNTKYVTSYNTIRKSINQYPFFTKTSPRYSQQLIPQGWRCYCQCGITLFRLVQFWIQFHQRAYQYLNPLTRLFILADYNFYRLFWR